MNWFKANATWLLPIVWVAVLWFGSHQLSIISNVFDQNCPMDDMGRSNCDLGKVAVQLLQGFIVVAAFAIPISIGAVLGVKLKSGETE